MSRDDAVKDEKPFFMFRPRKRRMARYGKYDGLPVSVLNDSPNGTRLVACGEQRFSVYPDELVELKRMHGSPRNWTFENDGSLRQAAGKLEDSGKDRGTP